MTLWNSVLGDSRREVLFPAGCSRMVESRSTTFPGPCSLRMTHVVAGVEEEYIGLGKVRYAMVVRGYCKRHAPEEAVELDERLSKKLRKTGEVKPVTLRDHEVMI